VSKSGKVLGSTATVDLATGELHGNSSSIWVMKANPSGAEPSDDPGSEKKGDDGEEEEDASSCTKPSMSSMFALLLAIAFHSSL
jgi:hypothetical protein